MEPDKPQRSPIGGSPLKKYGLIVGVIVAVVLLVIIIIAMATGGKDSSAGLLTIAQEQQELIRVSADGAKNSKSTQLLNFSATAQVSLASSQKDLTAFMAKHGVKTDDKVLALGKDAQTDQALSGALASNTYDTTFNSVIQAELATYVKNLDAAIQTATTKTEQNLLKKQSANAQLLSKMLTAL